MNESMREFFRVQAELDQADAFSQQVGQTYSVSATDLVRLVALAEIGNMYVMANNEAANEKIRSRSSDQLADMLLTYTKKVGSNGQSQAMFHLALNCVMMDRIKDMFVKAEGGTDEEVE